MASAGRDVECPGESSPLLTRGGTCGSIPVNTEENHWFKEKTPLEAEKVMQYDTSKLATWSVFWRLRGTIWNNMLLWYVAVKLVLLSCAVAIIVFLFAADPGSIDPNSFQYIAEALKVFVALLLGFFISSSVDRWGAAVAGFLHIFNAIRNLNMQFYALGVPADRMSQIARYGILSVEFLVVELRLRIEQDPAKKEMEMKQARAMFVSRGRLTEAEELTVAKVSDPSSLLWIWVASLIGSMAQDGDVPPMASPTYGRIMSLAQSAEEGIRQVNIATGVQMPFVYVHTLALLVHLNNMFSAISFGCTVGTGVAAILFRSGYYHGFITSYNDKAEDMSADVRRKALAHNAVDFQTVAMAFVTQMAVPLLYQAFLQIGLLLSQPFDSPSLGVSAIPIDLLISNLEKDLVDASTMAHECHGWEAPKFKK